MQVCLVPAYILILKFCLIKPPYCSFIIWNKSEISQLQSSILFKITTLMGVVTNDFTSTATTSAQKQNMIGWNAILVADKRGKPSLCQAVKVESAFLPCLVTSEETWSNSDVKNRSEEWTCGTSEQSWTVTQMEPQYYVWPLANSGNTIKQHSGHIRGQQSAMAYVIKFLLCLDFYNTVMHRQYINILLFWDNMGYENNCAAMKPVLSRSHSPY